MPLTRKIVRHALKDLRKEHGNPPASHPQGEPLNVLVGTILSQHTSDKNSHRAYAALRAAYPTWDLVAKAPIAKVEETIRSGGLARQKANTIHRVLKQIRETEGRYSLDRLKSLSNEEVYAYLVALPGVGDKTASCVLLFSLERAVMPVDTHIHRVSKRLGWVGEKSTPAEARVVLERACPPDEAYDLHVLLIEHGRKICTARNPKCTICPMLSYCPYGQRRVQGG